MTTKKKISGFVAWAEQKHNNKPSRSFSGTTNVNRSSSLNWWTSKVIITAGKFQFKIWINLKVQRSLLFFLFEKGNLLIKKGRHLWGIHTHTHTHTHTYIHIYTVFSHLICCLMYWNACIPRSHSFISKDLQNFRSRECVVVNNWT